MNCLKNTILLVFGMFWYIYDINQELDSTLNLLKKMVF